MMHELLTVVGTRGRRFVSIKFFCADGRMARFGASVPSFAKRPTGWLFCRLMKTMGIENIDFIDTKVGENFAELSDSPGDEGQMPPGKHGDCYNKHDVDESVASIVGSATLCFSRWIQRRGRQLH